MAHAWKACWVHALAGSNPASSAAVTSTNAGQSRQGLARRLRSVSVQVPPAGPGALDRTAHRPATSPRTSRDVLVPRRHRPPFSRGSIDRMVELRDATPADARAIAGVLVRSWRAAYRGLLPDDVLADLSVSDRERFWSDILGARPVHTRIVVAAIADAIVGFAATGPPLVPDDRADPTLGDLYALYLDPDVWCRGIGTQLHAAALG